MAWYKTAKGWISATVGTVMFIVTQWGNGEAAISIYSHFREHFHFVLALSPLVFFLLALYFFERERRLSKGYDISTLGGFALKLRDDLNGFAELYPKPKDRLVGVGPDEMIRKIERLRGPDSLRAAALENGFYLHFKDRVDRIYHEFGRFGIQDRDLTTARAEQKFETGYTYQIIADALERLSHLPEAREKMTSIQNPLSDPVTAAL